MDNINDILRAKRIVRQNGYTIKKPARDYDYEREDRMNLIRAKRIVKDAGYSYVKPNDGVSDNADDFDTVPTRRTRYQDDYEPRRRVRDDFDDDNFNDRPPRVRDEFEPPVRRRPRPVDQDDDFYDDVPPVRRRPRPSDDDSFTTRRQRLERPTAVNGGEDPNFPGRRRMREPVKPEGEPAPAATPDATPAPAANPAPAAPAAPATEDKPRQKTRQEIYQDIAAKYV